MQVRFLSHDGGVAARERLDEYLDGAALAAAAAAAEAPILIAEGYESELIAAVAATVAAAGGFALAHGGRLFAVADGGSLARSRARAPSPLASLLDELTRVRAAALAPAYVVRARDRVLDASRGAGVMGILNVTPDSFYDRGKYAGVDRARARAEEMVADGATVIDIGGQSYAHWNPRIAAEEERERVVPVVEALVRDGLDAVLSIDTFKASVAEAALAAGAHLINDCSGLLDPDLAGVVARYDAALVVMHLKGELNVRAAEYAYDDAMAEIVTFLAERTARAREAGVAADALLIDPGLEFGKEPPTDLEILERFGDLRGLGYPILFAASRKSFIGRIFGRPHKELLVPSLATAAIGISAGAALIRVHDVAETVQLARMMGAVRRSQRTTIPIAQAVS